LVDEYEYICEILDQDDDILDELNEQHDELTHG
jgi:hypothetical protein